MKKLNEILGTEFPIIQGGMANIATGEFAAACSNAGALGVIGTGGMLEAGLLRKQIQICKSLTDKPFGVNLMLMNPCADEMARVIVEEGVRVVTTGAGNPGRYIPAWKEAGIKVLPVVAAAVLARRLERYGIDAVIAEGAESGGHVGEMTTMALVPQVMDAVNVPVVAAGGIASGRQMGGPGPGGLRRPGGHLSAGKRGVPHPSELQAGHFEGKGQRHGGDGPVCGRSGAVPEKQDDPGVPGPGEAGRHVGGIGTCDPGGPPPGGI